MDQMTTDQAASALQQLESQYPIQPHAIDPTMIAPELGGGSPVPVEAASPRPDSSRKAIGTKRAGNGTTTSVFSGNRLRFLKKDDGEPLWRADIQFAFLKYVFEDENKVFTKFSDGTTGHTFADIYIDTMAKSSKCSQILKDKLLSDRVGAIDMAMICLLVNVGRMNTTLNCE
jgi:Ino eighty subunit 1